MWAVLPPVQLGKVSIRKLPGPWIKCSLRVILCFKTPHSIHMIHSCQAFSSWISFPPPSLLKTCSGLIGVEMEESSASIWLSHLCAPMCISFWNKKSRKKIYFSSVMFLPQENNHGKFSCFDCGKWKKEVQKVNSKEEGQKNNNIGKHTKILSCHACYATSCTYAFI